MKYSLDREKISGNEGMATIEINGNVEDLFDIISIEAKVEKKGKEINVVGNRWEGWKTTGLKGSGTVKIYYITSKFRSLMLDYADTGKDIYFTMMVTNDDPSSGAGKQTVALYNCNFSDTVLTLLQTGDEVLEEELPFKFSGYKILQEFNQVSLQ